MWIEDNKVVEVKAEGPSKGEKVAGVTLVAESGAEEAGIKPPEEGE